MLEVAEGSVETGPIRELRRFGVARWTECGASVVEKSTLARPSFTR